MSASILSFYRRPSRTFAKSRRNWSAQELAELYRVAERLGEAGIRVAVDNGLSDEGDPWAVFEQADTGEVIVHIARIDEVLTVVNSACGQIYRGSDFRAVTDQMLQDVPAAFPRGSKDGKVVIHPRTVLTAFVAAAVVLTEFVRGIDPVRAEQHGGAEAAPSPEGLFSQMLGRVLARESSIALVGAGVAGGFGVWSVASLATGFVLDDARVAASPSVRDVARVADQLATAADALIAPVSANVSQQTAYGLDYLQPFSTSFSPPSRPGASVEAKTSLDAAEGQSFTVEAPVTVTAVNGVEHGLEVEAPKVEIGDDFLDLRKFDHTYRDSSRPPTTSAETKPSVEVAATPQERIDTANVAPEPFDARFTTAEKRLITDSLISADAEDARTREIVAIVKHKDSDDDAVEDAFGLEDGIAEDDAVGEFEDLPLKKKVDASAQSESSAATPPKDYVAHFPTDGSSSFKFTNGQVDVFVVGKGKTVIENFRFGEDVIFVDGSAASDNSWFKSVTIIGDDIQIVGVDGSQIWLLDAFFAVA